MITTSPAFLDAIRQPHNYASQATIIPTSGDPFDVDIDDGSVIIDRTADHRRQLSLTLSNALLYPQTPVDPVAPYGAEVVVKRGIRQANGSQVLVQLGVFRIEDASRDTPGGGVTITGWDRSRQLLDERFLKPRKFAKMLATDLIQLLITEVYPLAVFDVRTTDTTKIPRHVVDRDRWPEVQRVAAVIGCEVYPDNQGIWVIQDVPDPTTAQSVWDVNAGENGVLISLTDTVTRENVANTVVAIGDGPPTVFLADGFARTQSPGWGTSGSDDQWNVITGAASDFDTHSSLGRIQAGAGEIKRIQAPITEDDDVDATAVYEFLNAITGGDLQASLGLRATGDGLTSVRLNVTWNQSNGHLIARPQTVIGGTPSSIGASDKDLGSYTAGNQINLRLRLSGDVVKAKAWLTNEPKGWDWDTSQSSVTNAGAIQVRLDRGSANTNSGSPQFGVDQITATATHTWYGIAHDDNILSPTYYLGAFGKVPVFTTNPHIRTQAQADRVARRHLSDILGDDRTISFGAVPNPALEAGDLITVVRPDGSRETHIIDALEIPLTPSGVMTGETRAVAWGDNIE